MTAAGCRLHFWQQEVEARRTRAAFTYGVICKIVCHDVDILDGLRESTIWEASIRLSRFSFGSPEVGRPHCLCLCMDILLRLGLHLSLEFTDCLVPCLLLLRVEFFSLDFFFPLSHLVFGLVIVDRNFETIFNNSHRETPASNMEQS